MSADSDAVGTVSVEVKNYADFQAKPRFVRRSTVRTYIIDPAGAAGPKMLAFTGYEPDRVRTEIRVYDNPVAVTLDAPVSTPDDGGMGVAPQGMFMPVTTTVPYEFFGPDAMWLNSIAGANPAKVTVLREYC